MPRYFFNLYDGSVHVDDVGEELDDASAALAQATVMAGDTLRDMEGRLRPGEELRLELTDEFSDPLYVIRVSVERA